MKKEQIALTIIGAFAVIVSLKFPVWGIIKLERKLDVYPLVSRDTVAMLDRMNAVYIAFDEACEARQAGERDAMNGVEAYQDGFEFSSPYDLIESATSDMYAAVAHRKALAHEAHWGLFKSMTIGGQLYTHATWLCAPAYADFTTQITPKYSFTYDLPAS